MSIKMSEYKMADMNFEKVCRHLTGFIRKTWNWQGMKPLDWDYRKDEDGREKAQIEREKQAKAEFNGPDTGTAGAYSVETRLTRSHVAYDNDEQGRDPLNVLVSSCIAYGMIVEQERQNRINHFNARAALHDYENRTAKAIAESFIEDNRREEFIKAIVDSYKFNTNTYHPEDFGFSHRHSRYTVEQWEGRFQEFLGHEDKELVEADKLLNTFILEKLQKKQP